ncbi:hypothetical protein R3I94_010605 [Phoxinus phoxinus]|uniref:Uncharacterized protein n=1 Tax=Phoxinus phoxinus TaxID=58324 RepID=A0AAN9CYY4_9TELE
MSSVFTLTNGPCDLWTSHYREHVTRIEPSAVIAVCSVPEEGDVISPVCQGPLCPGEGPGRDGTGGMSPGVMADEALCGSAGLSLGFCGDIPTGPERDPASLSLLSTQERFPLGLSASSPHNLPETIHKTLKCLACQISPQQAKRGLYGPN